MRKSLIALSLALGLTVGIGTAAFGVTGDTYGPNAQTRTDNGSCGNVWANDTFDRSFVVNPTARLVNGYFTYRITRYDKNGHFITVAGVSPGACNTGTNNGNTVLANVRGHFHGFVNYTVTCGTVNVNCYSPSGGTAYMSTCGMQCYTDEFIAAAFGPGSTYVSRNYKYVYGSANTVLCLNRWTDTGDATSETFTGDIATTCN